MAPSPATKNSQSKTQVKKEKLFHPNSRKAEQLNRTQNRKAKLAEQATARTKKSSSIVDLFGFFYHALPDEGELSLLELHTLIQDVWLPRHDSGIDEEQQSRRKGRPKSVKQQKLEELKLREAEEYKSGIEVPDVTHPENVALFRRWDQADYAFTQILRFVRISSADPDLCIVTRPGKHPTLTNTNGATAIDSRHGSAGAHTEDMEI